MKRSVNIRRLCGTDYYGGELRVKGDEYGLRIEWEAYEGGSTCIVLDPDEGALLAMALDALVSDRARQRAAQVLAKGPYGSGDWHGSIIDPDDEGDDDDD
jgi:hypothetical protein